jgi:hypothetical protein
MDNSSLNFAKPVKHPSSFFGSVGLFIRAPGRVETEENGWDISVEKACFYLDKIGRFLTDIRLGSNNRILPSPLSLHISGGEPFNDPPSLELLLQAARRNLMVTEVTTGGLWAKREKEAIDMLERFCGLINPLTVFVSDDQLNMHGVDHLVHVLEHAKRLKISTTILCGISPNSRFPRQILALEPLNSRSTIIRTVPLISQIRTSSDLNRFGAPSPPRYRRCAELMGLLIFPGGDLYPCSRSYGKTSMRLGNLDVDDMNSVASRIFDDHHLRRLKDFGPHFIFEACGESDAKSSLRKAYVDSCDFHLHALSDPALSVVTDEISARDRSASESDLQRNRSPRTFPIYPV